MDTSMCLASVLHLQVDTVIIKISIPLAQCPLLFVLVLVSVGWGLIPGTVCVNCIVLVGPGYDAAHSVLTSSMGEPAVESLVPHKAAIVTNTPKGAVFSQVVGIR